MIPFLSNPELLFQNTQNKASDKAKDAHESTKEGASNAMDKTKDVASNAMGETKKTASNAADKTKEAVVRPIPLNLA